MAADQDPMAEGYHVLGQLREGADAVDRELRELRDQANQEHADLLKQQEEAERMGDQASLERLGPLIDQAQQAWIVANEQLADDPQEEDQPQEDDDGDGVDGGHPEREGAAESGVERGDGHGEPAERQAGGGGGEGDEAPAGPSVADDDGAERLQQS